MKIAWKKEDGFFVGHLQEYPEYESQGETFEELKENLLDIFQDISNGLVEDAKPFQIMEIAV